MREASVSVRALKSRWGRTAAMGSMMPFSKDITRDVPGLEVRAKYLAKRIRLRTCDDDQIKHAITIDNLNQSILS
jgi:hypothetical protein